MYCISLSRPDHFGLNLKFRYKKPLYIGGGNRFWKVSVVILAERAVFCQLDFILQLAMAFLSVLQSLWFVTASSFAE